MPCVVLDIQLLVQALLYLALFVEGFAVSIPLGVTTMNFGGNCILYGDITWQNAHHFTYKPTNHLNCNFTIYLSVIGCIFYGLGMTIYYGYALMRKDPDIGAKMWVMPFILVNALLTVTIFISSCMVSVGFKVFCDGLMKGKDLGSPYKSCADFEKPSWNWNESGTDYKTDTYFAFLTVTQIATWTCFLTSLVQVALGILRYYRNRRLRSKGQAPPKEPADLENFASSEPTA